MGAIKVLSRSRVKAKAKGARLATTRLAVAEERAARNEARHHDARNEAQTESHKKMHVETPATTSTTTQTPLSLIDDAAERRKTSVAEARPRCNSEVLAQIMEEVSRL